MNNDVAIEYNAKILEIEDNIKQLGTLRMKTDNYKATIENIKNETSLEIQKCYNLYDKSDSNILLYDSLIPVYTNAIKRLDKINHHIISEYEDYYKIQARYKDLNSKMKEVDASNIREIVKEVLELLKNIKKSTPIDYEQERELVENIYELVYKAVKLELIYTNDSSLLETMKMDDIDTSYVSKLIKEDIEKLVKDKENEELMKAVQEIDKKGFANVYFMDKNLIRLLSITGNDALTKEVKNRFLNQIDDYTVASLKLSQIKSNNDITADEIIEIRQSIRKLFIKRITKKGLLLLNLGILSGAILGSIVGCRVLTKEKEYKTVKTTYDTSLPDIDSTIGYLRSTPNSVRLVEYSPWEEPGYFRDDYKRNVYTYDLDGLEVFYDDVKDYLTSDIKDYITFSEQIEFSSEVPVDDYSENKYVITQVVQDKSDYREIDDIGDWLALSTFASFGWITLDIFFLNLLSKTKLKDLKLKKRENKILLENKKQLFLETNTRIDKFTDELLSLKKNIEKEYDALPNALQQDENIKKKMLLLGK